MKVLVVGDIHWSTYSSIVRSRGEHFSSRLEHLIDSLNWVELVSREFHCEEEVFLGDTFDKPDLNAEEISALSEVDWNCSHARIRHFLVGNHESGISSLKYNSTQALHRVGVIEDSPCVYPVDDKIDFLFLPYITEDNRKSIAEYLAVKERQIDKKLIIFSHNDIKDFQMGAFLSTTGFAIGDIENHCDLYINGHLHNGGWVTKKILNLGNLCGQNFSEDASKYEHHVAILDTDTLEVQFLRNPYALNFYKIEINTKEDINKLRALRENAVLTIKCLDTLEKDVRKVLASMKKSIVEYRIISYSDTSFYNEQDVKFVINNVDHLEQFKKFCIEQLGLSVVLGEELGEVCK